MNRPAPTAHPIHDLLSHRWSPRAFAARPVDAATLARLFEAARWAPSSYNEQPWAFVVAQSSDAAGFTKALEGLIEFNRDWVKHAPALIYSLARKSFARNGQPNPHAWHDVGLAVANLTVQASAEGLVVHQMAGILPDKVRELFNVPVEWEPVTGIAIGYVGDPDTLPEKLRERELAPRERKPQGEFVFGGAWGAKLG